MIKSHEKHRAYRPRAGAAIHFRKELVGYVHRLDGNLCYYVKVNTADDYDVFIWAFKDGLNALHSWPGRDLGPIAYCPVCEAIGGALKYAINQTPLPPQEDA